MDLKSVWLAFRLIQKGINQIYVRGKKSRKGPGTGSLHSPPSPYTPMRPTQQQGPWTGDMAKILWCILLGRLTFCQHMFPYSTSQLVRVSQSPGEQSSQPRIRTLDMEVHFGFTAASESQSPSAAAASERAPGGRVAREVAIFERLARAFAVVGSNMETNAEGWRPWQVSRFSG